MKIMKTALWSIGGLFLISVALAFGSHSGSNLSSPTPQATPLATTTLVQTVSPTIAAVVAPATTAPTPTPSPTIAPTPTAKPTARSTATPKPTVAPTKAPTPTENPDTYVNSDGNTVQVPTYYDSAPAGATARCGDGTYSFSQHRSGTCSHHGGVAEWL